MDPLEFTPDDWERVLAACGQLRVGPDAPAYLQEFLARRLEEAARADLAARVRSFRDGQMAALWQEVRRRQA